MATGPKKPPRLPRAVMTPIVVAATSRDSVSVGIAQKGPGGPYVPMVVTQTNTKATAGQDWLSDTPIKRNAPPSANGTATWPRRSPVLSECHELTSIAKIARANGNVASPPTPALLNFLAFSSALGSHIRNPTSVLMRRK